MWTHKHFHINKNFCQSFVENVYNVIGLNAIVYGNDESTIQYVLSHATDRYLASRNISLQWEYKTHVLENDKHTSVSLLVRQCNTYFETYIQDFTNNIVKYIINDISKNMGIDSDGRLCSKLIVLHNIHRLSVESLNVLAVFMEKHVNGTRFLFTTTNANKIVNRIKSQTVMLRVPNPSHEELHAFISDIVAKEGRSINAKTITECIQSNDNHFEHSVNAVQQHSLLKCEESVLFEEIVQLIKRSKGSATVIKKLRNIVYILLVNDKSGSYIIKHVAKRLLKDKKLNTQQYLNIVRNAAVYEHRSCLSERFIYHIEAFFMSIL